MEAESGGKGRVMKLTYIHHSLQNIDSLTLVLFSVPSSSLSLLPSRLGPQLPWALKGVWPAECPWRALLRPVLPVLVQLELLSSS